jgi:hypothetical protein
MRFAMPIEDLFVVDVRVRAAVPLIVVMEKKPIIKR